MELSIKGKVLRSSTQLQRYGADRSPYNIRPELIAIPEDEDDVREVVTYSRRHGIPITARGAGSNLSGSAIGRGIITDFSEMDSITQIRGNRVKVQPGVIYDALNNEMAKRGVFLPYSPSSGAYCTIGGNVATKAAGLRSFKYGSVDSYVRSIRFVDAKSRVIDTSKSLPADLEGRIMSIRREMLDDYKTIRILRKRERLKSSSGYNLAAFYKYSRPEEIVTHLLVGSVGTLGLFTEIELELVKMQKERMTCLAYLKGLEDGCKLALHVRDLKPSAIEIMDSSYLSALKVLSKQQIPAGASAALLIEFDSNLLSIQRRLESLLEEYAIEYVLQRDPCLQEDLWDIRSSILSRIENENKTMAFVEDIAVPVEHLANFIKDVQSIFEQNGLQAAIYGHAGEGNLHLRPFVQKAGWKTLVRRVAEACYRAAFRYGGTVSGEHGMGRNKSPYITQEWESTIYSYFKKIKNAFDPEDLLNPGVVFYSGDIVKGMAYPS